MTISLLLNEELHAYDSLKNVISVEDFKYETNKKIAKILYDEFEKGNSNISSILDSISDEEILNQITKIMSDDYDITDNNKAIMDIIKIYEKNKLVNEKNEIINKLEDSKNLTQEEVASLENKLSELIIKLAKMK